MESELSNSAVEIRIPKRLKYWDASSPPRQSNHQLQRWTWVWRHKGIGGLKEQGEPATGELQYVLSLLLHSRVSAWLKC